MPENKSSEISDFDFNFFTQFLKESSGYNLTKEKLYLLESRLSDIIKKHKFQTVSDIVKKLQIEKDGALSTDVIEAMTVNETYFFRDAMPFDVFESTILPQLLAKKNHLRIWSGACSTGQEPYSIAMILENCKSKYPTLSYEIIASDINQRVIDTAKKGIYSDIEVKRGLPDAFLKKFFIQENGKWCIVPTLKNKVSFQKINLKRPLPLTGTFDIIFLRNVLIYFDPILKEDILKKVSEKMDKNGFLFLGAAEGIYNPDHFFKRCPSVKYVYHLS